MDWEIDSKWTKKSSKWILSPVLVLKLFKLWKLFNWKTCSWIQTTLNVQQLLFEFDFSIFRTVFFVECPTSSVSDRKTITAWFSIIRYVKFKFPKSTFFFWDSGPFMDCQSLTPLFMCLGLKYWLLNHPNEVIR